MKKLKKSLLLTIILSGMLFFGAWTPTNSVEDIRYKDAPIVSTASDDTIYFARREMSELNATPTNTPLYRPINGYTNSCGAVAGAIIVAYYDKYFPDLIPDWVSHFSSGPYRLQDYEHVPKLISTLHTLMRTNVDDLGVSENDFKNGLKQYINNNGHNVQYQSLGRSSSFNYSAYKNAVDNGKVVALLTLPCQIYNISQTSDHDSLIIMNITGPHIMVGYGYEQIKYYNDKGVLFRTDTYLMVAVGDARGTALYKYDSNTVNASYVVNIS